MLLVLTELILKRVHCIGETEKFNLYSVRTVGELLLLLPLDCHKKSYSKLPQSLTIKICHQH